MELLYFPPKCSKIMKERTIFNGVNAVVTADGPEPRGYVIRAAHQSAGAAGAYVHYRELHRYGRTGRVAGGGAPVCRQRRHEFGDDPQCHGVSERSGASRSAAYLGGTYSYGEGLSFLCGAV